MINIKKKLVFKTIPRGWHAYLECYSNALKKYGIEVMESEVFNDDILNEESLTGIHFHWCEYLWGDSYFKGIRLIIGLYKFLKKAKQENKFIIWTVHNHRRHDRDIFLDELGYRILIKLCDLIIVHSCWSKEYIIKKYKPKSKVVIMPHGNFGEYFKCNEDRLTIRKKYLIEKNKPVLGIIGAIRPYRGHLLAIEMIKYLENTHLIIAGTPYCPNYLSNIKKEICALNNVTLIPRKLSDKEYSEMIKLCDIILLPYNNITTSGALMASLGLGRSVVCFDHPYFREFITPGSVTGRIVGHSPKEMAFGVKELLSIPHVERKKGCLEEAKKYNWDKVVVPVVAILTKECC